MNIKLNSNYFLLVRNIVLFMLLSNLIACGDSSNQTVDTGVKATLSKTIDDYLQANQSESQPGLSIIVRKDGVVAYRGNKGMANKTTGVTISNNTGFRLASVSKPFTALAIMQLYEQEWLTLEDKLVDHIPELSNAWSDITIHHLLSHQSGIPDFMTDGIFDGQRDYGLTNQGLIALFTELDDLEFSPGTQGDYSNTGYVLLAEIVARVTGMSFGEYMQANVFGPAGMTNSYINNELVDLAYGDALNFGDRTTYFGVELYTYGSMAQVSSSNDLNLFLQALINYELVSQETLELMIQPHANLQGGGSYGYGWRVGSTFGHNGSWDGFRTTLMVDQNNNLEIIILTNGGEQTESHMNNIQNLIYSFYEL